MKIRSPEHCLKLEKVAGSPKHSGKQCESAELCYFHLHFVYSDYSVMKTKRVFFFFFF